MLDPFGSNPQDWTIMSWIGNVKWLEISGSRSVHDCGCAEGPSVDTQIHHARNSPHCVLLVSSFADRSSQLTLLEPGVGFGFHLTAIPGHENTGFLSTEGTEEIFTQRQVPTFQKNHKAVETRFLDEPFLPTAKEQMILPVLCSQKGSKRKHNIGALSRDLLWRRGDLCPKLYG